jgi:hypothetical protein
MKKGKRLWAGRCEVEKVWLDPPHLPGRAVFLLKTGIVSLDRLHDERRSFKAHWIWTSYCNERGYLDDWPLGFYKRIQIMSRELVLLHKEFHVNTIFRPTFRTYTPFSKLLH